MRVRMVMSQQVISAEVTESLIEAARRMRTDGVSALPVINREQLVGIISERDLVDAFIAGTDARQALVSAYMTPHPQYASPDDDSLDIAVRMLQLGIRHLPVVDGGQLVGMVSARDLLVLGPTSGARRPTVHPNMRPGGDVPTTP